MGDDLSVVDAARVSFMKQSEYDIYDPDVGYRLKERDTKLIKYLAEHGHWSPFAHVTASFRVTAPIFVARQLVKHQVGLSWNEVSRRYVDTPPEFFLPDKWRLRAEDKKQGSSEETIENWPNKEGWYIGDISRTVDSVLDDILLLYDKMLECGIAPEMARMILPQSMLTEWIWTGSLYAFARVCNLRLKPDAQKETQEIAKQISEFCSTIAPVSWDELVK